MPKCPECGKEIDYLSFCCKEYGILEREGGWKWANEEGADPEFEFYCPECGKVIFEDPDEAERWLENS